MSKVIIAEDPVKKALKEKKKPTYTKAEADEIINLILQKLGV